MLKWPCFIVLLLPYRQYVLWGKKVIVAISLFSHDRSKRRWNHILHSWVENPQGGEGFYRQVWCQVFMNMHDLSGFSIFVGHLGGTVRVESFRCKTGGGVCVLLRRCLIIQVMAPLQKYDTYDTTSASSVMASLWHRVGLCFSRGWWHFILEQPVRLEYLSDSSTHVSFTLSLCFSLNTWKMNDQHNIDLSAPCSIKHCTIICLNMWRSELH